MKYFNLLTWSALMLSLLIVFLSTHIRLGEAGLGCDPWPDCYARLSLADGVKGLEIPETGFRGYRHAHRYVASLLGINTVIIVLVALWNRGSISPGLPLLMFAVVLFLSVIGISTPTRNLPAITFSNILGGIVLSGLIWRQVLRNRPRTTIKGHYLFIALSLTLTLQLISGAWASANYTGSACPGLITCTHTENITGNIGNSFNLMRTLPLDNNDFLVPDTAASIIQFAHRLVAVILLGTGLAAYRLTRKAYPAAHKPMAIVLMILLAEFMLGVLNVMMDMPLWTNTLHNLLAVFLLFAVINLTMRVRTGRG